MKTLVSRIAAATACGLLLAATPVHAAETMTMTMPMADKPVMPFSQYQSWRDEPVQDWREANDRVGEIGGWMTYLREVQQGGGGAAGGMHDHHHHHGH